MSFRGVDDGGPLRHYDLRGGGSHSYIYGLDQARRQYGRAATARSHKTTRTTAARTSPILDGERPMVVDRNHPPWAEVDAEQQERINGPTTD